MDKDAEIAHLKAAVAEAQNALAEAKKRVRMADQSA